MASHPFVTLRHLALGLFFRVIQGSRRGHRSFLGLARCRWVLVAWHRCVEVLQAGNFIHVKQEVRLSVVLLFKHDNKYDVLGEA